MKLHIIGICGTFMGGLARLAKEMGFVVSGSDQHTYPPMSTQLAELGVDLYEGYTANNIPSDADLVLVGNTIGRGNPELEAVLEQGLAYSSGAQWLGQTVLKDKWVLAVAGTHGKTTTSSLLAWLLEDNDLKPGFLIGGVPENFSESARLGDSPFFVIGADEYDTAFSDKRSKFVHYRPRTLILNNLEYDHADIFADLAAIQTQFHHLLKIVPASGLVIHNQQSAGLDEVLQQGCWSETQGFLADQSHWQVKKTKDDASAFELHASGKIYAVQSPLIGDHNMANTVAAIAAAHHVGVPTDLAIDSLARFKSVKRRMETIYEDDRVHIVDDFAHHPTAISETLRGLRRRVGDDRILAVLEPRSNTMKRGVHKHLLGNALELANQSFIFAGAGVLWSIDELACDTISAFDDSDKLLAAILTAIDSPTVDAKNQTAGKTHVLIMSNGGFEGIYQRIIQALQDNNAT